MDTTKLTIRLPVNELERAKSYAESNQTSVTRLVSNYLSHLPAEESFLRGAPIVQSLIGILLPETTEEDYRRYINEKYGDFPTGADQS